jgi:hypothetical protein
MIKYCILIYNFAAITAQPSITVTNNPFDFGLIPQKSRVNVSYIIKNEGDSDLIIERVKTSCGCTKVEGFIDNLAPSEETKIELLFNSGNFKNRVLKRSWIHSNASNTSRFLLEFFAMIIDPDTMQNKIPLLPSKWILTGLDENTRQKITLLNNTHNKVKIRIIEYDSDILNIKLKKTKLSPNKTTYLIVKQKANFTNSKSVTLELEDVENSRITISINKM